MRSLVNGRTLLFTLILAAAVALAEVPHQHFDGLHGHNQYYPTRGYTVGTLPQGGVPVAWHGDRYWFHGGVWYRPYGPSWIVVAPPIGLFVPVLPPVYTTVVYGGVPYYYANDTYYIWSDADHQYQVVAAPPGADQAPIESSPAEAPAGPAGPTPGNSLFIYPRNSQTAEQQAQDKYECHRWAVDQTGFDPTQAGGGVPPDESPAKRAGYDRAIGACLDGRGYTVR